MRYVYRYPAGLRVRSGNDQRRDPCRAGSLRSNVSGLVWERKVMAYRGHLSIAHDVPMYH